MLTAGGSPRRTWQYFGKPGKALIRRARRSKASQPHFKSRDSFPAGRWGKMSLFPSAGFGAISKPKIAHHKFRGQAAAHRTRDHWNQSPAGFLSPTRAARPGPKDVYDSAAGHQGLVAARLIMNRWIRAVHYPSANFFNASFIWLKPSLVSLSKLFQNNGTNNPLNFSDCVKINGLPPVGSMTKRCSPSKSPGTNR